MWLLLIACAPDPAPPPPAAAPSPSAAPDPVSWTLAGRSSTEGLDTPSLDGGKGLLGPGCATLNEALRGDGPPCFVEVWAGGDQTRRVERAGTRLHIDGARGRTRWSPISGTLSRCLGDPLALPPAGDPGATRQLDGDEWVITLSGANPCAVAGDLRLHVSRDRAQWSGLTVAGDPWDAGGREHAATALRAALRELVRSEWDTLSPGDRADALRALADDPHPDAAKLLRAHTRGR